MTGIARAPTPAARLAMALGAGATSPRRSAPGASAKTSISARRSRPTGDAVRYLLVLDLDPLGARAISTVGAAAAPTCRPAPAGRDCARRRAALAGDTALSMETVRKTSVRPLADPARSLPSSSSSFSPYSCGRSWRRSTSSSPACSGSAPRSGSRCSSSKACSATASSRFYVPFAGIILLIALGSDYNVYLVGRVWSEARTKPLKDAIAVAGERATPAITVAGVVLALSFAALAIVDTATFSGARLPARIGPADRRLRRPLAAGAGADRARRRTQRLALAAAQPDRRVSAPGRRSVGNRNPRRLCSSAQVDLLANSPATRLGGSGSCDRLARGQQPARLRSFASSVSRAASLTASPITVYS